MVSSLELDDAVGGIANLIDDLNCTRVANCDVILGECSQDGRLALVVVLTSELLLVYEMN